MLPTRLNIHKIKNWLHFIKFHEKVDKIKWPYFFDLMHIWPCFGCLLLCPFLILKYFFLKKPSTDFFKNHLKSLFYIYFIIFHRKIQSDPPKNLVAAFRQCAPIIRGISGELKLFPTMVSICSSRLIPDCCHWWF